MKLTDPIAVSPDAVANEVGRETMLLDLVSGTYFGLDELGGLVWRTIADGRPAAEACDAIMADYDVEREVLERDVLDLLGQLAEKGLIVLQ